MGKILAKFRELQSTSTKFPFQNLPDVCKLKIFSYLGLIDKGLAAQVCREWNAWLQSPSIWMNIDLTQLPLHSKQLRFHRCTAECHAEHHVKIGKFLLFLGRIRPLVIWISISWEITGNKDDWLELIQLLFSSVHLNELRVANLIWKATMAKPLWSRNFKWSLVDLQGTEYTERRRQRHFAKFFEMFAEAAPRLEHLTLPFDWSLRSIRSLIHLKNIQYLTLDKFFDFQVLDQTMLDMILQSLQLLRHLVIEIWTPSGSGLIGYQIHSDSLLYLDILRCRGLFLSQVGLQNIRILKVSRHEWKGPLELKGDIDTACLHQLLSDGAPRLQQLNDHFLEVYWREHIYEKLDRVLRAVCSCKAHKQITAVT